MYSSVERSALPTAPQQSDSPLLAQRSCKSLLVNNVQRGPVHAANVPISSTDSARLADTSLWNRLSLASFTPNLFSDSFAGIATPLLLSRSIRETTLHRVEGGLARIASNYATTGDDSDDVHNATSSMEVPDAIMRKDGSVSVGAGNTASSSHTAVVASHPRLASPSSSLPPGQGVEATMNFESLWNNIDRYLFAVYTTLQTDDESSLRSLRTPKHRMGWYTVIYNACSGNPTKSRELYTRLALLLLQLLESLVLFPILQNVDHSRIQFLTGVEDSAAEDQVKASLKLRGNGAQQQPLQAQQSTGGGSSSGWGRLRSIATGGSSGNAGAVPSKDTSSANSSFGFMRRLFQSSHRATSPAVASVHHDVSSENSMAEMSRQTSSPGGPLTPSSVFAGQELRGRGEWFITASGSSTPIQVPPRTSIDGAGACLHRQSSAVSTADALRFSFEGFDSTVHRNSAPAQPPPHSASSSVAAARAMGLTIKTNSSLTAAPTYATSSHSPPTSPAPVSSQPSTVRTGTYAASSTSSALSQTPTTEPATGPRTVTSTAPPSAISSHHARVASKTGRVLVNDEEEVLCEENTVSSGMRHSKHHRRLPSRKRSIVATEASQPAKVASVPPLLSEDTSTQPHVSDDVDDDSLHTMNSLLSSRRSSRDAEHNGDEDTSVLAGGNRTRIRRGRRRVSRERRGPPSTNHTATLSNLPDDETEDTTAVPSANFVSPSSTPLVSVEDVGSSFLPMEPLDAGYGGTAETIPVTKRPPPPSSTVATPSPRMHQLPQAFRGAEYTSPDLLSFKRSESVSSMITPRSAADPIGHSSNPNLLSRQTSCTQPGSCYTGRETAVPTSPSTTSRSMMSPHEAPLYDSGVGIRGGGEEGTGRFMSEATAIASDRAGTNVYGGRRFSLCYTFIQEWQTFLIFRGVVLSCFRYLDQYYTRRYGMDTITLMCFKVFYVAVYEPLRPLLMLELSYLTRYVREVFEATGQIAWEQMDLIQVTYNTMAELLVLVQSTSSYMVAQQQQQQQQQKSVSGGVSGATVPNTTNNSAAAAVVLSQSATAHASVEKPPSRTNSRGRSFGVGGEGIDSNASSVGSTPRMGSSEAPSAPSPSFAFPAINTPATSADHAGVPVHRVSHRRRLLSFFAGKRHSEPAGAGVKEESHSAPLRPTSLPDGADIASRSSAATNRRPSPFVVSLSRDPEGERGGIGDNTGLSAVDEVGDMEGVDRTLLDSSSAEASPLVSPESAIVVVDLRGTVELRDRLEGHTTAHHLTTQALKQWEGLAADRRLRNGTIVKETAKPLSTIVMEDMGNDYVAGIYSFYRYASEAHRNTEDGRRSYVVWAVSVKELETHVWHRVRLPVLHTALRSALNEVLVVEPHRAILLDRHFGFRALLDEWSASLKRDDLALLPQVTSGVSNGGGGPSALRGQGTGIAGAYCSAAHSASTSFSKAASELLEAPIQIGLRSAEQYFISSFPRTRSAHSMSFDQSSHPSSSQIPLSTAWEDDTTTTPRRESSWRWERVSEASLVINSATAASTPSAALSALSGGSSERFVERGGTWVGGGDTGESPTRLPSPHPGPAVITAPPTPLLMDTRETAQPNALSSADSLARVSVEAANSHSTPAASLARRGRPCVQGIVDDAAAPLTSSPPAIAALQTLYSLFRDVAEDECFVLMAAVLITKFFRDAADLFEDYINKTARIAGGDDLSIPNQRMSAIVSPSPASAAGSLQPHTPFVAVVANSGVQLMTALVDLIDRYTELVEGVFQDHPVLHRAMEDAVEEVMCPTRWTKKGSLQAARHRTQEMLMAAAAAASVSPSEDGAAAVTPKSDLPSVLLSRDARHAMLPLVSLATLHPQAVQQLKLSVALARYADAFLQQEQVGGRVVSSGIFKRLRLIGRLVSLLEDKDTFLEHYRLCLARRLLGTSVSAAPPSSPSPAAAAMGRDQEHAITSPASYGSLNLEAERQLVSCLQSYLGTAGTHAFEAMLRDYEGTQRTRDLFEQEPAFEALSAKIRVQLITSAQWPMYTMLPLTPHLSLQQGMDAFRDYYAKIHPSRTLLWIFSLGTATLTAELSSNTQKQIVASTLLATLLLVISDAYNAQPGSAGFITGAQIAQKVGLPFSTLRTHLHLLSQHRAFSLLRWTPPRSAIGATVTTAAAMTENDCFTLNPAYTHKLRKIRLPLPKTRLTGLPSSEAAADCAITPVAGGGIDAYARAAAVAAATTGATAPWESEDAVVTRHVNVSRRLLLDTALVRVLKSRRVVLFEDLFQAVTAQLSRQFVPTRRDVKAQLEGLIDRDYVKRSADDPNEFLYVS